MLSIITCADRFIYQLVEIVIMGEDYMAAHVEKKSLGCHISACEATSFIESIN